MRQSLQQKKRGRLDHPRQRSPFSQAGEPIRRASGNARSPARSVFLSDAWTFLVIREAFFGSKRFEEFRSGLEITRATLTDRLRRLTAEGILRETTYSDTSSRVEYKLTKAGIDLYPTFMALMQFGDRWLESSKDVPLQPHPRELQLRQQAVRRLFVLPQQDLSA